MIRKKPIYGTHQWVPNELAADLKAMIDHLEAPVKRRGRPPSKSSKRLITLRLDPDVIAKFRATGDGWQTRINEALRRAEVTEPGSVLSQRPAPAL